MKKDENGYETKTIDWTKTRAWAMQGTGIYINLEGKWSNGIVASEDQYELEEQIMTDLYSYKSPQTGKRVIAYTLRKKDAVFGYPVIAKVRQLNGLPVYVFYMATLVLFFVLTQFCHHLVLAMVLTPTLLVFCVQTGGNPVVLIAGINVACQMAYLTPGVSSLAAMFHGNSERVNVKDGYFLAPPVLCWAL